MFDQTLLGIIMLIISHLSFIWDLDSPREIVCMITEYEL